MLLREGVPRVPQHIRGGAYILAGGYLCTVLLLEVQATTILYGRGTLLVRILGWAKVPLVEW